MPKDRSGKRITWKVFFKRWKKGILGVTAYQQAQMAYLSTWIVIIGILLGLIFAFISLGTLYWLLVILIGAMFNTIIIQIGNYQKYQLLKRFKDVEYE